MHIKLNYALIPLLCVLFTTRLFADPMFPALTSPATTDFQPGKFIWADLVSSDPEASIEFYTAVFGWEIKQTGNAEETYYHVSNNGKLIAGIVPRTSDDTSDKKALWVGHISTPDIHAATTTAENLGAHLALAPKEFGQRGLHAIIRDPQGAVIGLLQSSSGDPVDNEAGDGPWAWAQLFSTNPTKATAFYTDVFAYETKAITETSNDNDYLLRSQNTARASIAPLPASLPQRDRWVGFINVDNLKITLAKSTELGARVIYPPREQMLNGRLAIIADPNGALLGLIESDTTEQEGI